MSHKNLALAFCVMFASAVSVSAAVIPQRLIDVDFNGANNTGTGGPNIGPTTSGAAVIGSAGDTWNGANGGSGSLGSLVNAAAAPTTVSVNWSATGGWNGGGSPAPNPGLMQDYLYQLSSGTGSVTISGLRGAGQYQIYLYTQNNDDNNRQTDFTVTGDGTATASSGVGSQGLNTFTQGTNYSLVNIESSGAGTITIQFGPDAGHAGEADFNGFQLLDVTTPEPSSIVALSGLGLAGLVVAFRRRRARKG